MSLKQYNNGYSFKNYYEWEDIKNKPYDYEREGLLNKIVSHNISGTKNPVLKKLLGYYESSIVWLLKYTDILKNFKNINWKNR